MNNYEAPLLELVKVDLTKVLLSSGIKLEADSNFQDLPEEPTFETTMP